jgi:hypothetical protein
MTASRTVWGIDYADRPEPYEVAADTPKTLRVLKPNMSHEWRYSKDVHGPGAEMGAIAAQRGVGGGFDYVFEDRGTCERYIIAHLRARAATKRRDAENLEAKAFALESGR